MSSYWWPLGRTTAAPPATAGTYAKGSSTTVPTSTTTFSAGAGAPLSSAADMRHLAQTAFHASLESLLVEATKHRSLLLLRDAVQETRQRRYDPMSLFNTLCIACSLLAERSGSGGGRSFSNTSNEAFESARKAVMLGSNSSSTGGGVGVGNNTVSGAENAHLAASLSSLSMANSATNLAAHGVHHSLPLGSSHALHYCHHGAARHLLLQSIGDLVKLIALGILPVTLPVGQRVADLVREIAFLPPAGRAAATQAHASHAAPHIHSNGVCTGSVETSRKPPVGGATRQSGSHTFSPKEKELPDACDTAISAVGALPASPVQLVRDDPVLVRLLQLTASAASVSSLGSAALPELYGVLIVFYSGVTPNTMLEATCEATLSHHIHTVLSALRDNRGSRVEAKLANCNNSSGQPLPTAASVASEDATPAAALSPFIAQLHGIAFIKDICRLIMGARTCWLNLSQQCNSNSGSGNDDDNTNARTSNTDSSHPSGERGKDVVPVPRKSNSASSSMAAVTASVVAAAADAERQQQQQQNRIAQGGTTSSSLSSTSMATAIASANLDASLASFGSPLAASGARLGGVSAFDSLPFSVTPVTAASMVAQASSMEYVPERLRAFLVRAVTLFFKEQNLTSSFTAESSGLSSINAERLDATAGAAQDASLLNESPLYVQCLNDCLFSVALWGMYEMDITVPMQPPPSLFVEVMQQQYTASHSSFICSLDLFTCTQQLAVATITTNLSSMKNSAQVLIEAHELLLRRLYRRLKTSASARSPVEGSCTTAEEAESRHGGSDVEHGMTDAYAERLSQAAIAVLMLWRKTLTCSSLLWELLQLCSTGVMAGVAAGTRVGKVSDHSLSMMMVPSLGASSPLIDDSLHQYRRGHHRRSSEEPSPREYDSEGDDDESTDHRRNGRCVEPADEDDVLSGREEDADENTRNGRSSSRERDHTDPHGRNSELTARTGSRGRETRFRQRPQSLTLAHPRGAAYLDSADGAMDTDSHEDNSDDQMEGVGSLRHELAPLARLVISVVNLIVAYMRVPQTQQPSSCCISFPHISCLETCLKDNGNATNNINSTLLSVTQSYDAEGLPADTNELAMHGAATKTPYATAEPLGSLQGKQKLSHRTPLLAFCIGASPQTVYQCLTEAINFMTVFGQYFCQLAESKDAASANFSDRVESSGADNAVSDDRARRNREHITLRCSAWFLNLHPYLLRCGRLCLRYLRYEEDVLPVVLKGIGYWVQVSCALQLTEQRDAHLYLLVGALSMPDPVVGHLVALSPPTSFISNSGININAKKRATSSSTASSVNGNGGGGASPMVLLETLISLHNYYASLEPVVPGSVAAAALRGENIGDFRDPGPTTAGQHSRSRLSSSTTAAAAASAQPQAAGTPSWGVGWLRRRSHVFSSADRTLSSSAAAAETHSRTVFPAHVKTPSSATGGLAGNTRLEGQETRSTPSSVVTQPTFTGVTSTAAPVSASRAAAASSLTAELAALGWRAPTVQHVVILGVCRLQHKISIMKTLHVVANALGADLDGGWALLARGTALTEPLLHMLKRLLTWIEETSVEHEQQEQLLSDAFHLRDALRSLCVDNTCRLPYAQLNIFFSELVKGTVLLSPSAAAVKKTSALVLSGRSWPAGFNSDEVELDSKTACPLDELYDLSEPISPYTMAYARLPRHDPRGCADQWVLTSECLCLSLLAMLPFTEQRVPDTDVGAETTTAMAGGPAEMTGSDNNNADYNASASPETNWRMNGGSNTAAAQLQRQHSGALMRALRLWQLETDVCRYVMDTEGVAKWSTVLVTSTAAHQRVLLLSAEALNLMTKAQQQRTDAEHNGSHHSFQSANLSPVSHTMSEEETRVIEGTLTLIVGHVTAVAAHLCRSSGRRRSESERESASLASHFAPRGARSAGSSNASGINSNMSSVVSTLSYQMIQSAALVLTSGPFVSAPLTQTANAVFAAPAGSSSPVSVGRDSSFPHGSNTGDRSAIDSPPSLLPFVQIDAALSTAAITYALQRTVQASSTLNSCVMHHHEVSAYASSITSSTMGLLQNATITSATNSGSSGIVLDPLEQLLACPFALLDDIYHQWTQPQRGFSGFRNGCSNNKDAPLPDDFSSEDAGIDFSSSRPHQQQDQRRQNVDDEDEDDGRKVDDSPPTPPLKQFGNTTPEVAAAASVVVDTLPQLLMYAATNVLMDVVKVVQAYGEDIDGAAWEPILSSLERTATLAMTPTGGAQSALPCAASYGAATVKEGSGLKGSASGSSNNTVTTAVSIAHTVESLNTAFRALESIQHNHIPRLKVEGLHRLIVCAGAFTVHRVDSVVPGERKLHINLSAVQLLWSTADYLAASGGEGGSVSGNRVPFTVTTAAEGQNNTTAFQMSAGDHGVDRCIEQGFTVAGGAALTPAQQHDRLWCSLLWQLRNGCLDDRQEIRQSAMQTFFALVQTYGWRFSGVCWRCVLMDVLLPLIEVVSAATALCATPPPQATPSATSTGDKCPAKTTVNAMSPSTSTTTAATTTATAILQDPVVRRLLKAFMQQPSQLEETRVTIYDGGSRLFVTHYVNMQTALQNFLHGGGAAANNPSAAGGTVYGYADGLCIPAHPGSPADLLHVFRGSNISNMNNAGDATRVLEALLQLCGDVCVVVRGTSGEQSAVAAVHALHGLLVEMHGSGLHPYGVHLAWRAMERLLFRGDGPCNDGAVAAAAAAPPPQQNHLNTRTISAVPVDTFPFAHTEVQQCTLAVVAAVVAAVCDSFRLQRMVLAAAAAAASATVSDRVDRLHSTSDTSPNVSTTTTHTTGAVGAGSCNGEPPGLTSRDFTVSNHSARDGDNSSYFGGWGSKTAKPSFSAAGASPPHSTGRSILKSPDAQCSSPAQYFTRLLYVLQAVNCCHAVVNSYYFPSKPQMTLLEGITTVWPTLTSREARMLWGEVLLPSFPSLEDVQRFVLQDVSSLKATDSQATDKSNVASSTAASLAPQAPALPPPQQQQQQQPIPLRTVMPPGSHPSYLSALMDTMRSLLLLHMGVDPTSTSSSRVESSVTMALTTTATNSSGEDDRTRLLFMAPSTVHVTGTLLLLHLASPAVLAVPPRVTGVPFTLPALFLQECVDLLQFTLWGPVLSRGPTSFSSTPAVGEKPVAETAVEREGYRMCSRQPSEVMGVDSALPVAAGAARCRREGVATLCRVFESFLAATSTAVRFLDADAHVTSNKTSPAATPPPAAASPALSLPLPATNNMNTVVLTTTTVPQHVAAALQSLDRLVDTLGEVVRFVIEQYGDVDAATEAINALSVASTAEGVALARVAKRSLALLQRWADAVGCASAPMYTTKRSSEINNNVGGVGGASTTSSFSSSFSPLLMPPPRGGEYRCQGLPSANGDVALVPRSQLQDVVRASMEARNKAIMKQYIENPDEVSTGALLIDTLRDMLRVARSKLETESCNGEKEKGGGEAAAGVALPISSLEQWDCFMPELLQLVACCSQKASRSAAAMKREKEVRETLSSLLSVLHERRLQLYQFSPCASTTPHPPQRTRVAGAEAEEAASII